MIRIPCLVAGGMLLIALPGCGSVSFSPASNEPLVVERGGPPPHAPAHGYRRKHANDAEMRFDPGIGVYVVVGQTDVYFDNGSFIRLRNGGWEASTSLDGPWTSTDESLLPPGLRSTHPSANGKSNGKGSGKQNKW